MSRRVRVRVSRRVYRVGLHYVVRERRELAPRENHRALVAVVLATLAMLAPRGAP